MKDTLSLLVFMSTFIGVFFLLSTFGLLYGISYNKCLTNGHWQFMYSVFFGWWIAMIVTQDAYNTFKKKGL